MTTAAWTSTVAVVQTMSMGLLQLLFLVAFVPFSDAHFHYNWTDTDCGLFGDPHIRAFNGARGTILLPCRFQASEFTTNFNATTCTTKVFAFGRVLKGGVYTGGVEIDFNIISLRFHIPQHWMIKFVLKKGCLSSGGHTCQWGKSSVIRLGPSTLNWTFHQSFVMLQVPFCGLKIVYKLNDKPPGVIISAKARRIITVPGYHNNVFCGNKKDTLKMYVNDAKTLKLDDVNQVEALAYRILSSNLTQQIFIPSLTGDLHPNAGHCTIASASFGSCSPLARLEAIKTCLGIFKMRSLLHCFTKKGETYPMYVFSLCINSVCTSGRKSCTVFKYEMSLCISGFKLRESMKRGIQLPCLGDKGERD